MQFFLFAQQLVHGFAVHFVGNTAVYRANGSALRLIVEALALSTLIGSDIVYINGYRSMRKRGISNRAIHEGKRTFNGSAVGDGPFYTAFIDRVIWTFRFTCATVNTFVGDLNSHKKSVCLVYVRTKLQLRIKYPSLQFLNKTEI